MAIAAATREPFGRLVVVGMLAMIAFQMLVNVGMTVGLLPVTGIPLPFLSYGGSAMLVNWTMWGLFMNVNAHWQDY